MIPLRLPLSEEKIDPPVTATHVEDGYNDTADKDINRPEAERIADDLLEIVQDKRFENQTIGVISLQGMKQHKLLEQKIREKIGDAEYVKRKIICGNPYDLQGDERDIVFLSMVVAPNRNFRALTTLEFKQRYNVAASRARNQLRLYHSVSSNDLNTNDLRYSLLSYCQSPARVQEEIEDIMHLIESPFERDVIELILAKGYRVTPQVKVGNFRIDIVVEGIRNRLAVEVDGEKWHGPEKFEADMERQSILERSGWKFWRIRGREFYLNRKQAMESLWTLLNELDIQPYRDFEK
jgi:very-short-patch-repair endonuclease